MRDRSTSRRNFLKGLSALPLGRLPTPQSGVALSATPTEPSGVGSWSLEQDLPVYTYTGPLTFPRGEGSPGPDALPDDPYFLLGNHRLTLFAHASGHFQILTGERAWGRMNQGATPWSGANTASLQVEHQQISLVGSSSEAANRATKRFGIGFAQYMYAVAPQIQVTRTLSVAPSRIVGTGESAFVLSVSLKNLSRIARHMSYREEIGAAYAPIFASFDTRSDRLHYMPKATASTHGAFCSFAPIAAEGQLLMAADGATPFETDPPALFVAPLGTAASTTVVQAPVGAVSLRWQIDLTLEPGAERAFECIVGYTREGLAGMGRTVAGLTATMGNERAPYFRTDWQQHLPRFSSESDAALRREMRWHAGMLEAMATWKQRYNETLVPQGMTYDYDWGRMLSSRDWAQHALPLCTTNPPLARSVLRLIMKRMHRSGEIELNEQGFGWVDSGAMRTSDQQLFFFLLLNEYLRATGDRTLLTETLPYFGEGAAAGGRQSSGLDHVSSAFLFLRDHIGTGPHGLVRLWNSDWNDLFYFWPTALPYNTMFDQAESHMNSAMAIVFLDALAMHLGAVASRGSLMGSDDLVAAISVYRATLLHAFMADWGQRTFPRRAYLGADRSVGEEEMWLEPQGYALQIAELTPARRQALYNEIERRLMTEERLGARQIEKPEQRGSTLPGTRENGGFWFALHGPVALAAVSFDKELAKRLLERMTLARYATEYPQYWVGQWTGSDAWDSSVAVRPGLSKGWMPFCAHAHAWPLYVYLRLNEAATK